MNDTSGRMTACIIVTSFRIHPSEELNVNNSLLKADDVRGMPYEEPQASCRVALHEEEGDAAAVAKKSATMLSKYGFSRT